MAYDIEQPYGPLIETTVRVATWNVWGRFGPWREREPAILAELKAASPDLLVVTEAWENDEDSQADRLGEVLGLPHSTFSGVPDADSTDGSMDGLAILSRWPLTQTGEQRLGDQDGWDSGRAIFARADGPRGPIQVFGVGLGWKMGHSAQRQGQVRDLGAYVRKIGDTSAPVIVCGDFNAPPDSDEIRMLTGRTAVAAPGLVFYDAWEVAGDGTPGYTFATGNPWARPVLWPDRRIDYVFSAWPRAGGAGHPVHCGLLGTREVGGIVPSDHYGVVADLRY
ncbi:endonuclease/exonuclease/phosphatase family protein [Actinomadura barringtoniae]|uniref:Endonuclease/exonuclease/phosphatase family protein n=1 Tax=Actinomadura barringtoniae TaxID=1427535 RepID=A0A939PRB5_9ACTN|nr:endonuclease/exonuclease/phosphatase family protein [Actinomadura barringtoniae]MBO2453331.1 endonuclease/exonuclease/phosphatase family protein [Actinomadura barringtoniae]